MKFFYLTALLVAVCFGLSAQFTCSTPLEIECGDTVFGNTSAVPNDNSTSGAATCVTSVGTNGQYWYVFTPAADGTCTLSTEGASDYDTKIHVYTGTCGNLSCVTGDDDSGTGLLSLTSFDMVGGTPYLLRVGGFNNGAGNFQFNISCDLVTDGCTSPEACNYSPTAINDDGSCCFGLCRRLVVGGGSFVEEVAWQLFDPTPYNELICTTPGCGFQFVMNDAFGDGWNGNTFVLSDENGNIDAFGTLQDGLGPEVAIVAIGGFTSGCTDSGANNYDPSAQCDDGSCIICAAGSSLFTVNMFDLANNGWGGATWTIVDDATGASLDSGSLLAGNSDSYSGCLSPGCYTMNTTAGAQPSQVSWNIRSASGSLVAEGGAAMSIGFPWGGANCAISGCTNPVCNNYNFNAITDDASCVCPPSNDVCANATPIGCGQVLTGTTINANLDPTAVSCDVTNAITSAGVWYTFIGTGDLVNFSTCGSAGGDTKIHVFTGNCSSLECVTDNDDGCSTGFLSNISFTANNGVAYYVLVSEYGNVTEGLDFQLSMECVSCVNTPFNDECTNALPLPTGVDFYGNLCCANPDIEMDTWAGFGTEYGVWYIVNSGNYSAFDISFFSGLSAGPDLADGTDVGIGFFDGSSGCGALTSLIGGVGFNGASDGFTFNTTDYNLTINPNSNYYICISTSDPINCGDFVLNVSTSITDCTNPDACNFNPNAIADDGSCYFIGNACDDGLSETINDQYNSNCECTGDPEVVIPGCTDPTANNYNPQATIDDGSCTFSLCSSLVLFAQEVNCTPDESGMLMPGIDFSFSYDGTCTVQSLVITLNGNVSTIALAAPDNVSGSVVTVVNFPQNATFTAYFVLSDGTQSPLYTLATSSCVEQSYICDCDGTQHTIGVLSWLGDTFADDGTYSWEGQPANFNCATWGYDCGDIIGSPTADPYSVCLGNLPPNNGCSPDVIFGCTDPAANNYNPLATIDDGSCTFDIVGCTNPDACNYSLVATTDDGSCYFIGDACDDGLSATFNDQYNSNCECSGDPEVIIPGCTDPTANNYNPQATVEDGSCTYTVCENLVLTAEQTYCQPDANDILLPGMDFTFEYEGNCTIQSLVIVLDGAVYPFDLVAPDNVSGSLFSLVGFPVNSSFTAYFTLSDGTVSAEYAFATTSCDDEPTICDCDGVQHSIGVLIWLGDSFADAGTYLWAGQPVDFNCATWGYDCGDISGAPSSDPYGVCEGNLPPNNGLI